MVLYPGTDPDVAGTVVRNRRPQSDSVPTKSMRNSAAPAPLLRTEQLRICGVRSGAQVAAFSLVWVAYAATYLIRKPLGVVKTVLGKELSLSMKELGWLDTALILPYAAVQIGLPSLSETWGARRIVCLCLLGGSVSSAMATFTTSFLGLVASLFFTGALLAPCWPACSSILTSSFSADQLNSVFGMINTATYSGAVIGTGMAASLMEYSGWRSVFLPPAGIAAATAMLLMVCLPSDTSITMSVEETGRKEVDRGGSPGQLLALPCVKELSLAMFCLKFARYLMYMWLPLYLVEGLGYTNLQAGSLSMAFDVGGILGSPLLGIMLDLGASGSAMTGVTRVMIAGAIFVALFIATASWGLLLNGLLLVVVGAANCGPDSMIAGSITMEIGEAGERRQGSGVTSLVNGIGNIGGMVEGPLVGVIATQVGWTGVLFTALLVTAVGAMAMMRADQTYRSLLQSSTTSAI